MADLHIDLGHLDGYHARARVSTLSGQPPDRDLRPVLSELDVAAQFTYTQAPYSFTVLRIPARRK